MQSISQPIPISTDDASITIDSVFHPRLNFAKTAPALDEKGRALNGGTLSITAEGMKSTKIWVETPDPSALVLTLGQTVTLTDLRLIVGTAKDSTARISWIAEKVTLVSTAQSSTSKAPVSSGSAA